MGIKIPPRQASPPLPWKQIIEEAGETILQRDGNRALLRHHKLLLIMHSCGYVESPVPGMLEAGIDCLQVIEVKVGLDLLHLFQNYGDQFSSLGGIDVRCLYNNGKREIDTELEAKIPLWVRTSAPRSSTTQTGSSTRSSMPCKRSVCAASSLRNRSAWTHSRSNASGRASFA